MTSYSYIIELHNSLKTHKSADLAHHRLPARASRHISRVDGDGRSGDVSWHGDIEQTGLPRSYIKLHDLFLLPLNQTHLD